MPETIKRAASYIWGNARLIDRQIFSHLFLGGPRQAALDALRAYQNNDGGFGHALEPDIRTPLSAPQPVEIAFHVLDMLHSFADPMVARACAYLQGITTPEGGVPYVLPTVAGYPHAPWWTPSENPPASANPTAALAGLLLKHGVAHPWLEQAVPFCWKAIEQSDSTEYHDLMPMICFLEHSPERARAERELRRIGKRILDAGAVADEGAAGYAHGVLDWAPSPQSYCRTLFDERRVQKSLAALAAAQREDGGWEIMWDAISPACALEWRGWVTVKAVRTLRAYGAI
ncbi:hypothetical protein F8S13_04005 [Chloroflexia bacterium SDU3-3]|nr:hypothetical protein F8S13_04005 [Chloroflexia bacterium SDU3-3]